MNSYSNQSDKKRSSVEDRITGKGESSFASTLIKIAIALFIASSAILLYIYIAKPAGMPFTAFTDSTTVVSVIPVDSIQHEEQLEEQIPSAHTGMTIIMDDPNEPPYRMLGVISQDDQKLYTFELPDGGPAEDDNDSTLTFNLVVETGTNLSESLLTVAIRNGACVNAEEAERAGVMQVGDIGFMKSEMSDAGAGQYYNTFNYSFEKNGKCIAFSLQLHSANAQAFDPPVQEFDLAEKIKGMEDMLKTIKAY